MKNKGILFQFLLFFSLLLSITGFGQGMNKSSKIGIAGVFDGRTPCQELARLLNQEPVPDCIKIKWRLKIFTDGSDHTGTYELQGMTFREGKALKGNWTITRGTFHDKEATVLELELPGEKFLYLQKADDNVLFFLDQEKHLMVGNYDFSYTLNRKNE